MNWIRVTITSTAGSAPRGVGTQMLVHPDRIEGTIGGGALEWQAMQTARRLLQLGQTKLTETYALGPELGQCCGGSVKLQFDLNANFTSHDLRPIWVYGAGHVGRQVATVLSTLPDCDVTLIDVAQDRFPKNLSAGITPLVAAEPARVVRHAPDTTEHLIMTYSHDIDLSICNALLKRPFARIGLIGSATKWARFRKRLAELGHSTTEIDQISCPIGDPGLGKHPAHIAIGIAATLIAPAKTRPEEIAS